MTRNGVSMVWERAHTHRAQAAAHAPSMTGGTAATVCRRSPPAAGSTVAVARAIHPETFGVLEARTVEP